MPQIKLVYWFEELGEEFNDIVGKKCANLGEMMRLGMNVPPGFALSLGMYKEFARQTGLQKKLERYILGLGDLKNAGIKVFEDVSKNIRAWIEETQIPEDLSKLILDYYNNLSQKIGIKEVPVSVRSAGTQSRPGMFETYLNVKGGKNVLEKVKKVWASSFTTRALAFRVNKDLPILSDELGVAIVKMVNARCSGICFTVDPVTGDDSKIIIEANWGLGEGVVSGAESVDGIIIDKDSFEIVSFHVGKKSKCVLNTPEGADWVELPPEMQSTPCIAEEEAKEIARIARTVEEKLGCNQDMEWAIDKDLTFPKSLFWLQTRPAKVAKKAKTAAQELAERITTTFSEIDLSKAKETLKNINFRF